MFAGTLSRNSWSDAAAASQSPRATAASASSRDQAPALRRLRCIARCAERLGRAAPTDVHVAGCESARFAQRRRAPARRAVRPRSTRRPALADRQRPPRRRPARTARPRAASPLLVVSRIERRQPDHGLAASPATSPRRAPAIAQSRSGISRASTSNALLRRNVGRLAEHVLVVRPKLEDLLVERAGLREEAVGAQAVGNARVHVRRPGPSGSRASRDRRAMLPVFQSRGWSSTMRRYSAIA